MSSKKMPQSIGETLWPGWAASTEIVAEFVLAATVVVGAVLEASERPGDLHPLVAVATPSTAPKNSGFNFKFVMRKNSDFVHADEQE